MQTKDSSRTAKSNLFRTASMVVLLSAFFGITAASQTQFKSLVSFSGVNGSSPGAGALVQVADGTFYGTTFFGGTTRHGNVFKVTPSGELTSLYSFCMQTGCADGEYPLAGLLLGSDGNFYGTTGEGGLYNDGTVFKITPSGVLTTLHSFQGNPDGWLPQAGLVEGMDGNFYGTTQWGGAHCDNGGCGSVFKMTPDGQTTILHSFAGGVDGRYPVAGLVLGTDGTFYGTTFAEGAHGGGTVFKITSMGALTTLYSFCAQLGCADGNGPFAALLQASDGNFYGTTEAGGIGAGNFFRMTPDGSLTSLFNFCPQFTCDAGDEPMGALVQGSDGNFYGTTSGGGPYYYYGTVFEITPQGALTNLHNFRGQDGTGPWAGLVKGQDGYYYGTTSGGGVAGIWNGNLGTVFRIAVSHSCATCRP